MMLTGKALFHSLLTELNEMGLPGMSATLDEMYRSPGFPELEPLMAIAGLVEPEYEKKRNKRIQSRLRSAHLRGVPRSLPAVGIPASGRICPVVLPKPYLPSISLILV